jgi:hypothetical protein
LREVHPRGTIDIANGGSAYEKRHPFALAIVKLAVLIRQPRAAGCLVPKTGDRSSKNSCEGHVYFLLIV